MSDATIRTLRKAVQEVATELDQKQGEIRRLERFIARMGKQSLVDRLQRAEEIIGDLLYDCEYTLTNQPYFDAGKRHVAAMKKFLGREEALG